MILRVEIVRRDSGDYVATLTHAGGYVEDVGPFADLWEVCSVVGGIDEYRADLEASERASEIDRAARAAAALRAHVGALERAAAAACCRAGVEPAAARRRRGDTEPLTFDAAAAAAERLAGLKK